MFALSSDNPASDADFRVRAVKLYYTGHPSSPGDLNCDGHVDFGDINPFVLALADPAGYHAAYPNCERENADIDGNGNIDFGDINPFVALLAGR